MIRVSGPHLAQGILNNLKTQRVPSKSLVAVLVGNDPASLSFLKQKSRVAIELEIDFELKQLPRTVSEASIKDFLQTLSQDNSIGGIILQLPLPKNLPTQDLLNSIPIEKDIDCLSTDTQRLLEVGESKILPPAAAAVQEILNSQHFDLSDKTVAVVGLGRLVGRPIAAWLKNKVEKLITIDVGDDLNQIVSADLAICGVGKPKLINPCLLKSGAAVIDFGYGKISDQYSGDLDTSNESTLEKLSFYTPTPGGTGPILAAKLLENFFSLTS